MRKHYLYAEPPDGSEELKNKIIKKVKNSADYEGKSLIYITLLDMVRPS